MKKRHKTQREYRDEGIARDMARARLRQIKQFDLSPTLCEAFVRGLMKPTPFDSAKGPTPLESLEDFIKENNLEGELLREALSNYSIR